MTSIFFLAIVGILIVLFISIVSIIIKLYYNVYKIDNINCKDHSCYNKWNEILKIYNNNNECKLIFKIKKKIFFQNLKNKFKKW